MKNKILLLSSLLLALPLMGCEPKDDPDPEINYEVAYETQSWDNKLVSYIAYSVGDAATSVPKYETSKTIINYKVQCIPDYAEDDDGEAILDDVIWTTVIRMTGGINFDTILDTYKNICTLPGNDFMISSLDTFVWKMYDATDDLVIEYYLDIQDLDEDSSFTLRIYRIQSRIDTWPIDFIKCFVGDENLVPSVPGATGYQIDWNLDATYLPYIYMYCYGVEENVDETYAALIRQVGYTCSYDTTISMYVATNEDETLSIQFAMDYDGSLYMRIINQVPVFYYYSLIEEFLPSYPYYDGWAMLEGSGFEDQVIIAMYYANCNEGDIDGYAHLLKLRGWIDSPYEEDEGYHCYVKNYQQDNEHAIQLSFSSNLNELCVAVLY